MYIIYHLYDTQQAKMRFYSVLGDCILCKTLASYRKAFAILFQIPDSVTDIGSMFGMHM